MSRPFSRHYWDLVDDPRFVDIFPDDHHYATWSRLLMLHDQAWPASAALPAGIRKKSLDKLVEAKLLLLLPNRRFKIAGLDQGRSSRSSHAKSAAESRWNDDQTAVPPSVPEQIGTRNDDEPPKSRRSTSETRPERRPSTHEIDAPSIAAPMPLQDRQDRQEEQSQTRAGAGAGQNGYPVPGRTDDDRDSLDTYHELTRYRPWGQFSGDKLRSAMAEYGKARVDEALAAEHGLEADRNTLLDRTLTRLARDADRLRLEGKARSRAAPRTAEVKTAESREVQRVRAELILESGANGATRAAAEATLARMAAEDTVINPEHPA